MPRLAVPLSDLKCRTAKPRERAYKLFDGGGMYLFVKPNGVKTWRLRYFKPSGKEGTLIIGNYPIISLAVARTKRDEAKALLIDNLDPMEEKKKAKVAAQRASLLFQTVALEWHAEMSRRWTEGHAKTVMSRLRTHVFPLIGQRPIAELDTHDLLEVTLRIKERGTMDVALRVQNYLSTIMRGAKRARQINQNPALDLAGSIHAPRTVHRPALSLNRLAELLNRIDNYNGRELTKLAVLLTLHVFVRSSELRFARWDEFDLQRAMWEIPDTRKPIDGVRNSTRGTKMSGDIQMVPLSPQVIAILERLRGLSRFSELVLPGDHKYWKPMSENTVNQVLRNVGYDTSKEVCGHGFRTMACSALLESGLWTDAAIERQMSHKERNRVRAAYIHKAEFLEQRRLIMAWWSNYIDANRSGHVTPHEFAHPAGDNITPLPSGRGAFNRR
ncbi:integrase family protein [Pseudomonas sp. M47T1]|uniref:tyrosine-type recombinase/integrase n=1 Tax=Pseudomonas sp. M47T1 TaxID=1179778 RepID=UPI00026082BB|nr:integrase arm-type DNA-binding domain-containing protein [Pseudomonas sp. M47T1]EIK96779.1 integrase family protein [Pseudomonas sp. M47T1]